MYLTLLSVTLRNKLVRVLRIQFEVKHVPSLSDIRTLLSEVISVFICDLFNEIVSYSDCIASNSRTTGE
jgi:hypothetical protein